MIEPGKLIRARVLKVEPGKATLGIYVEGMWRRITARTQAIDLKEKEWIEGTLTRLNDTTYLFTKA